MKHKADRHRLARREGGDDAVDKNLSTISPPVLILQNTGLPSRRSHNGKAAGMTKGELNSWRDARKLHWKDCKPVYRYYGHMGVTLAIYDKSEEGYLKATCDDNFFKKTRCGRFEWEKLGGHRSSVNPVDKDGLNIIYGYLATEDDMKIYDRDCKLVLNWRVQPVAWEHEKAMAENSEASKALQKILEEKERTRKRNAATAREIQEESQRLEEDAREWEKKLQTVSTELERLKVEEERMDLEMNKKLNDLARDGEWLDGFSLSNKEDLSSLRVRKLKELMKNQEEQRQELQAYKEKMERLAEEEYNRGMLEVEVEYDAALKELEEKNREDLKEIEMKARQRLQKEREKALQMKNVKEQLVEVADDAELQATTFKQLTVDVFEKNSQKVENEKAFIKGLEKYDMNQHDNLFVKYVGNIYEYKHIWMEARYERARAGAKTLSVKEVEELLSEADTKLRDPDWHIWTRERGDHAERGIDYDDPFLKKVEGLLGSDVRDTIVERFKELEDHCSSGRYPTAIGIWCRKLPKCEFCKGSGDDPREASYEHILAALMTIEAAAKAKRKAKK